MVPRTSPRQWNPDSNRGLRGPHPGGVGWGHREDRPALGGSPGPGARRIAAGKTPSGKAQPKSSSRASQKFWRFPPQNLSQLRLRSPDPRILLFVTENSSPWQRLRKLQPRDRNSPAVETVNGVFRDRRREGSSESQPARQPAQVWGAGSSQHSAPPHPERTCPVCTGAGASPTPGPGPPGSRRATPELLPPLGHGPGGRQCSGCPRHGPSPWGP